MKKYMEDFTIPWPALDYSKSRGSHALKQYEQMGIPNLVFIDRTGKVLSSSYVNGQFQGPYKVLEDMRRTLK